MSNRIELLKEQVAALPLLPGVYKFLDRDGKIIYVGKAKSLRKRVSSYFVQSKEHSAKVRVLVKNIYAIEHIVVGSEQDALLLENSLIKANQPRYNILLKDDKHYPYIRLDLKDMYPRVTLARRQENDGARYFGPYIGATAVRDVLDTLRKLFPMRTCKHNLPEKKLQRPCINYEIGRCLGPCCQKCTPAEYRQVVDRVVQFLGGKYQEITADLRRDMQAAAMKLEFENVIGIHMQACGFWGGGNSILGIYPGDGQLLARYRETAQNNKNFDFADLIDPENEFIEFEIEINSGGNLLVVCEALHAEEFSL